MGSFTSVPTEEPDFEENCVSNDTPLPMPRQKKRILNIDPRSPSGYIPRTPIVVDRTPSNLDSPTPERPPVLIDPRSPTTNFTRTPIGIGHYYGQFILLLLIIIPHANSC